MRVLEMELENFSRIFTGVNKTKLKINFTLNTNRLNLFVGENGTGKTAVMSCIHPFAFNPSLDNRDNSELILPNKNGKKIWKCMHDGKIYEVTHIYTRRQDSITVKSYISEDGEELNETGLVGTFLQVVEEKLHINETFLSLLALGNNITGFIDMSPTKRKEFFSKLFKELDLYGKYYKKISNDAKYMSSILTNIESKLKRYAGYNIDELQDKLNQLKNKHKSIEDEIISNATYKGSLNNKLSEEADVIKDYESKQNQMMQLVDDIKKLSNSISSSDITNVKSMENTLNKLRDGINDLNIKIAGIESDIKVRLDIIDSKRNSLSTAEVNKSTIYYGDKYDDLLKMQTSLQVEIDEIKNKLKGIVIPPFNKDDLIRANIYLDEMQSMYCTSLVLYGNRETVLSLFDKYRSDKSIVSKLTNRYDSMSNGISSFTLINNTKYTMDYIDKSIDCEINECPYKTFYQNYMECIKNTEKESLEKLNSMKDSLRTVDDALQITSAFDNIFRYLDKNFKNIVVPKEIFNMDDFVERFIDTGCVYDNDKMIQYIDILETNHRLELNIDKYQQVTNKLDVYNNTKLLCDNIDKEISNLTIDINKLTDEIESLKVELSFQNDSRDNLKSAYNIMESEIESIKLIISKRQDLESVKNDLKSMDNIITNINKLKDNLNMCINKERELSEKSRLLANDITNVDVVIRDIQKLKFEERELNEKYDVVSEIKKALSPTKGIPVIFIETFMTQMVSSVNELLDKVYNGNLRLVDKPVVIDGKEFKITVNENEFKIPYIKKGTYVNDIKSASQGERSLISLAISFTLIKLYMGEYNLMLLDEMDTNLDERSRYKYIIIIDAYLDSINAEQAFMVSHNNMFDSYPVDLIQTSEYDSSSMQSVSNIIKIY